MKSWSTEDDKSIRSIEVSKVIESIDSIRSMIRLSSWNTPFHILIVYVGITFLVKLRQCVSYVTLSLNLCKYLALNFNFPDTPFFKLLDYLFFVIKQESEGNWHLNFFFCSNLFFLSLDNCVEYQPYLSVTFHWLFCSIS